MEKYTSGSCECERESATVQCSLWQCIRVGGKFKCCIAGNLCSQTFKGAE